MQTSLRLAAAAIAALVLTGPALAAPQGHPQYVGPVTGDPERDTFGYVVTAGEEDMLCIVGPKQYFGRITGDPEKDTYGYAAADVPGTSCAYYTANRK